MRYERMLVEIVLFERGWVTLSKNFTGKGVLIATIVTKYSRHKTANTED